ncbi:carboxyl transferase domain-containing protein [Desulfobacter sp.]|uniref:acyl-CoA carboxylase subunit beta n=1 Tax=Desulfobacter sp. TaxID=2294 RepID=UPI000E995225|nr:carboxyl transferase domain-containing protein [Desulfobacter sp.]HBT88676.1 glutaconyl-CoA decarboxylase subunit alpha [Desulfobacter sp.]
MKSYFENMTPFGKALKKGTIKRTQNNYEQVLGLEKQILAAVDDVKNAGISEEKINQRGQMTVWQRLEYIVDPGTWTPLHTLFNPADNVEGTTNVIDGLGKIAGKWAVVIGFDNKVMAGAWLAGQSENILRVTDLAKILNIPLVWLVNCSGAKLTEQEKFYANRRGSGTPFFRHAELEQDGIPVLAAIYGTNPAGGGYHAISPTVLFAHEKCNMAVGGAGIVSGMSPQGGFTADMAEALVQKAKEHREKPPGSVATHYDHTGFFRFVYKEEKEVLDGVREYMKKLPAYDPEFFRVTDPRSPAFEAEEVMRLLPIASKTVYDFDDILARLVDGSEHMEYRPDYGPEVYTGLCKVDGFLVACIGNRQGYLGKGYPEYADYPGMGAKLYRQGLLKMNEFVTLCGRDRIPVIWFQDTSGIDVGDIAEKAELLGLGQSLVYSIQQSGLPMMLAILRKGTAAAHYVMGGPQANRNNAFTLGTCATEICVMHGETAAVATYARRLVKEKQAGRDLGPVVEKMNALARKYKETSTPLYCAKHGMVDEVVRLADLRHYMQSFAGAVYQNPRSICPQHQMILPRIIRDHAVEKEKE